MGDAKRRIIYEWFVRQKRRLEGVYPGAAHINNTINTKVKYSCIMFVEIGVEKNFLSI